MILSLLTSLESVNIFCLVEMNPYLGLEAAECPLSLVIAVASALFYRLFPMVLCNPCLVSETVDHFFIDCTRYSNIRWTLVHALAVPGFPLSISNLLSLWGAVTVSPHPGIRRSF